MGIYDVPFFNISPIDEVYIDYGTFKWLRERTRNYCKSRALYKDDFPKPL